MAPQIRVADQEEVKQGQGERWRGSPEQEAKEKLPRKTGSTKKDYELVAESDTYKMYLYEKRLSVLLENKETGKIIESTLSDEKDDGNSNQAWNGYMKSGVDCECHCRSEKLLPGRSYYSIKHIGSYKE